MTLFIDKKFVSLLSTKLENFKQKSTNLWNFKCPVCGDSRKNKLKSRGYFYCRKSNVFYKCHNCNASMSLGNFIKSMDKLLYREYQLEKFKESNAGNVARPDFTLAKQKPIFEKKIIDLPSIQSLPDNHVAKKYILDRKIPKEKLSEIYYAEDFKKFVHETFPNSNVKLLESDPRIVIPFLSDKNVLLGIQGRAVSKSKIRYITIKSSEDVPKIYGLNKVDFTKTIYVVEGPIDSMFLTNGIATMDSSLYSVLKTVGSYDYVFIPDIQPRNKEVIKCIEKCIELGKKVCLLPQNLDGKDINEIVLSGLSPTELINIIEKNTYEGLKAKLHLQSWRKI